MILVRMVVVGDQVAVVVAVVISATVIPLIVPIAVAGLIIGVRARLMAVPRTVLRIAVLSVVVVGVRRLAVVRRIVGYRHSYGEQT